MTNPVVPYGDIGGKISVSRPYFALENLRELGEGRFYAEVVPQMPLDLEITPIMAAEAGRHMAILGLCGLALQQESDEKSYYLAIKAVIESQFQSKSFRETRDGYRTKIEMQSFFVNKRRGHSKGSLMLMNGVPVFAIETEYRILRESLFDKLFQDRRRLSAPGVHPNPYADHSHLTNMKISDRKGVGEIGEVHSHHCPGHFRNYPALPVAILCGTMSDLAGKHLQHLRGDAEYSVKQAIIEAERLAFCGDFVRFESDFLENVDGDYKVQCRAVDASGGIYGSMILTLN